MLTYISNTKVFYAGVDQEFSGVFTSQKEGKKYARS